MDSQKHLLVIRFSAMGDVAMTVPVISAVLNQYPNTKITFLTRGFFQPIFSQISNVEVYAADLKGKHKGLLGLWRLYKELKTLNIDAVVDLHNVLRSTILKQFFSLGNLAFKQIDKGRAEKNRLTAKSGKVFKPLKTTHQRYADVFQKVGFTLKLKEPLFLPKREMQGESLKAFTFKKATKIGIAPFAAYKGKTYPLDLMEEVIAQLSSNVNYNILFFGGGKKEQIQFENWEIKYPNTVNTVGKLTFSEELDLISNLDLMVAMDSGNAHLASLFNVPTITIWGITHPYAGFYPFGQEAENALLADRAKYPLIPTSVYGNKMPKDYGEVMRTINPKEIFKKVDAILKNK